MKFLIVLISIITNSLFAVDNGKYYLSIEVIGKSKSKKMQLDNGTVYLLYENSGGYTDNFGNYGNSHCYGKIKTKKSVALNFKIICETVDQNGNKFWGEFTRSETEMAAGVGKAVIVDGTGIYKNLINTKCVFSTRYLDQSYFSLSKCKLTKTVFEKLKK